MHLYKFGMDEPLEWKVNLDLWYFKYLRSLSNYAENI